MLYSDEVTTGFEDSTFQEVVESWLYTSDNMFGEIVWAAGFELARRLLPLFPPPSWFKELEAKQIKQESE